MLRYHHCEGYLYLADLLIIIVVRVFIVSLAHGIRQKCLDQREQTLSLELLTVSLQAVASYCILTRSTWGRTA
jgi:hypothetical protein